MADAVRATVKRPSALSDAERTAWRALVAAQAQLQWAFFTPTFAEACEAAHGRAWVTVLRQGDAIIGFLPFQFAGGGHAAFGAAERIGGALSDAAGLVGAPGTRLSPAALLRHSRLGALFLTHLMEGQAEFGLLQEDRRTGYMIELDDGPEAYLDRLATDRKRFFLDTRRILRRAEREAGPFAYAMQPDPPLDAVLAVIEEKRQQYRRTGVGDPFDDPALLALVAGLVRRSVPECRCVLETLSLGGRPVARHFGLLHGGHLTYWFPVYDGSLKPYAPGRVQLWHTILAARDNGITRIDLGEGESQLKQDFATRPTQCGRVNWRAGGPRGMVAALWQSVAWKMGW